MSGTLLDTLLGAEDLYLLGEGTHRRLFEKLGAQLRADGSVTFAVWAPNAESVGVAGDFNGWDASRHQLAPVGVSGVWSGSVRGLAPGTRYMYHLRTRLGQKLEKADPCAFRTEIPPKTASVVWDQGYEWGDAAWLERRAAGDPAREPMSVYELHLGSWRRVVEEGGRSLTYREIAPRLVEHVQRHGFTHVELLPVTEHPFYGSWGYQSTGYFAPTSRYGSPQDLMWLIDQLHHAGIGVLLDWVPSHFPDDAHGLALFDGTHLYEHADPRRARHPDWNSFIFNYERHEVRSFLISSAIHWLERYHFDGLRVDAVASMLYLDYSRHPGKWIPNVYGGHEDLGAITFLRDLNEAVHAEVAGTVTIAEESTAWPMVSRPTHLGGLGFDMKWDMGWMHDTLRYLAHDPILRKFHQSDVTFRSLYAFAENYVLPLSHDEVVHGKGSFLARMPGDGWQKLANLRLLYANQYAQPGKKVLFMGGEFGQWDEWRHDGSLDWHLLERPEHAGISRLVAHLARTYASEPALHELDWDPAGFEWVDASDHEQSVVSFLRRDRSGERLILAVFNGTPIPRDGYRLGVPRPGRWRELVNTDATEYGGSGRGNLGGCEALPFGAHGRPYSLVLTLPPLAALFLLHEG